MCQPCYSATQDGVLEVSGPNIEPNEVHVRKVGETVVGTVSSLATALEYPINIIKDSARPDYWVPDSEISQCSVCDRGLSTGGEVREGGEERGRVHHCRQCGQGVCNSCSATRR